MTDNELKIRITAESSKAVKEIQALSKEVVELSKSFKSSATDVSKLSKSFSSLGGTLTAESSKAVKEVQALSKEVVKLSKSSKSSATDVSKLSKSFSSLGGTLTAVAGGFTAFEGIKLAVGTISDFESSMVKLKTVSNATAQEFELLESTALKMGESTKFSATEASEGLNFLAMAGFSATDAVKALPSTLDLAVIGNMDLARATDIASDSLTGFGLEASDMDRVVDAMAVTITSSNTTVEALGSAFSKVAPVANAMGISVESTAGALGVMADAGIKAEVAGTNLKIILNRLATDKGSQKAMKELGVAIYDTEGNFRGLEKITADLKPALAGLDAQAKQTALKKIFGSEAIASGAVLIDKTETLTKRVEALNSANGEGKRIAKEMSDTLDNSFKAIYSAVEGLILSTSNDLLPIMKDLTKQTVEWIRSIDKKTISDFAGGVASLVKGLVSLASGIGTVINFLGTLASKSVVLKAVADGWGKIFDQLGRYTKRLQGSYTQETTKAIISANQLTKAVGSFDGNQAEFNKLQKSLKDTIEEQTALSEKMRNDDPEYYAKQIKALEKSTLKLTNQSKILAGLDPHKTATASVKESINADKDKNKSLNTVIAKEKELTEAQKGSLAKTIADIGKRESTAKTSLDKMLSNEQKLKNDLVKLEEELANIRKGFANKRENLVFDNQQKIADIEAKGLDEHGKYIDAQKRADEALSLAKKALSDGDLAQAKKYQADYLSLIQRGAGDEIKVGDEIRLSQSQTAEEYKKDLLTGQSLSINILNKEEAEQIRVHNTKINNKKLEISMIRTQIEAEKALITQMGLLIAQATGAKFEMDFTTVDASLAKLDSDMAILESQKRTANIEVTSDTTLAETKIDTLTNTTNATTLKPAFSLDTTQANAKVKAVQTEAKQPIGSTFTMFVRDTLDGDLRPLKAEAEAPTMSIYSVDTAEADRKIVELKSSAGSTVQTTVNIETTQANTETDALKTEIEQPINSTLTITDNKTEIQAGLTELTTPTASIHTITSNTAEIQTSNQTLTEPLAEEHTVTTNVKDVVADIQKIQTPTASTHNITADATQPINTIKQLQQNTSSVHTVYVQTIETSATGGVVGRTAVGKFATGGGYKKRRGKIAGHDLTGRDDIPSMLTRGEFVQKVRAVDYYGVDFMKRLNSLQVPKSELQLATGGIVDTSAEPSKNINLSLMMPDNKTQFSMQTDEQIAGALERYIRKMR